MNDFEQPAKSHTNFLSLTSLCTLYQEQSTSLQNRGERKKRKKEQDLVPLQLMRVREVLVANHAPATAPWGKSGESEPEKQREEAASMNTDLYASDTCILR